MLFKPGTPLYSYEVQREAGQDVMYVNYLGASYVPSIADSGAVMGVTIDTLMKASNVSRIVFVQQRNYNYDFAQVALLQEIAGIYTQLMNQEKVLSPSKLGSREELIPERYNVINYLLGLLKSDPVACYTELKRQITSAKASMSGLREDDRYDLGAFLNVLRKFFDLLHGTGLIRGVAEGLADYKFGERGIYKLVFRPDIIPNFIFTRLVSQLPEGSEMVDQYTIGKGYDQSTVTILKKPNEVKHFYHIMPPEYSLKEGHHMLLNLARNVLIEHQPKAEEFTDPERTRQVFFNVSRDLLRELAESQGIRVS